VPAVEHETCDACRFDGARYDNESLLVAVRALGPTWRSVLTESGSELRQRPAPEVWSALEYAAHTRDILALHAFGVEEAITHDEPSLPALADDLVESAAASYAAEDREQVLAALDGHARRLAQLADDADPDGWVMGLTIGSERSEVRQMLEHALHDALHHVDDVERGLLSLRGSPA
jgi:hypothetical protein